MQRAHKTFKYKKTPGISLIIWEKEAFMNAKLSYVPRKWLRICCRGGYSVAFSHTHRIPSPFFLFTGGTTLTYKKDPPTHIQCFPTYAWGGGRHFPHRKEEKWKGIDPTNGGDSFSPFSFGGGDIREIVKKYPTEISLLFFANAATNGFLQDPFTYSRTKNFSPLLLLVVNREVRIVLHYNRSSPLPLE